MTSNSAFDDHIKKQFEGFEPEVPAHIWENIMRDKDKKRPAAWWHKLLHNRGLLVLLLLLLTGTATTFLLTRKNDRNELPQDANTAGLTSTEPANAGHAQAASGNAEKNQVSGNSPTGATNQDAGIAANPEPLVNGVNAGSQEQIAKNTKNRRQQNPVADNSISATTDQTPAPNPDGVRKSRTAVMNGTRKNNSIVSIDGNEPLTNDNSGLATSKRQRKKDKGRFSSTVIPADASADEPSGETGLPENLAELRKSIFDRDKLASDKSFSFGLKDKKFTNSPVPCPEKNAAGNKKYIEVYGGPDYAFRSFNDTANSQYLQRRKESTRFASAFSAGLRYTRVFSNAVSFRAGINYSQVNENFRFVQGNIIQVTYITNSAGDTTGSFSSTVTRYKTTRNRYRTIDIPVSIGYEIGNERLHANLNAGLVMNLYSWQRGDVLDSAYQPVSITTGKANSPYQFKTNIGLGFIGAASIYYKLNDRFHLLAEPYIRYNLSPANKPDITLKQKFTTMGLRLGIRIDL